MSFEALLHKPLIFLLKTCISRVALQIFQGNTHLRHYYKVSKIHSLLVTKYYSYIQDVSNFKHHKKALFQRDALYYKICQSQSKLTRSITFIYKRRVLFNSYTNSRPTRKQNSKLEWDACHYHQKSWKFSHRTQTVHPIVKVKVEILQKGVKK